MLLIPKFPIADFVPKEESFPTPPRENDCWNVDDDRNLSVSWTVFTEFPIVNEKLFDGKCGLVTKIQGVTKPDHQWPENWSGMSQAAQLWSRISSAKKNCGESDNHKSKHARIAAAHGSVKKRFFFERTLLWEDRVAGRGSESWVISTLLTSAFTSLKQWKSHMQKPLWTKSEEARKICQHGNNQSEKRKRGHPRRTKRAVNTAFCSADGHRSSQEMQRPGRAPRWHCERRSRFLFRRSPVSRTASMQVAKCESALVSRKHVCLETGRCVVVVCPWSSSQRSMWATHGLHNRAPVIRGCPCRDPPVCHKVQGDSVSKRQPILVWLLVCSESWHRVFCALVFHVCRGMCNKESKSIVLRAFLILSSNQSSATLWVLDTCLIAGLLPSMIILVIASLSSNTQQSLLTRGLDVQGTKSMFSIAPIFFWFETYDAWEHHHEIVLIDLKHV